MSLGCSLVVPQSPLMIEGEVKEGTFIIRQSASEGNGFLAVLKVFGLDHHASSIVEVFHPLGTFWAMTIKKKFHAVSPIVLQPHSFLNDDLQLHRQLSITLPSMMPFQTQTTWLTLLELCWTLKLFVFCM